MVIIKTYITVSGDTFDKIAFEQLGSEYLLPILLESNQKHRLTVIFESGIELKIPVVEIGEYEDIPEWLVDNFHIEGDNST